jgi:hypothetical protein
MMTSWARESSSSSTGPETTKSFHILALQSQWEYGAFGGFSFLKYHIHEFWTVKYKLFIYCK